MSDQHYTSDPRLAAKLAEFKLDQYDALMSLDEQKIRAFHRKWNHTELPSDPMVFWGSVHKAITGCLSLPIEQRKNSKEWLDNHGLRSLDDGDLSV